MTGIERHRLCIAARAGLSAERLLSLASTDPELATLERSHLDAARIAADERWLDASGVELLPATSPLYPPLLAHSPDAPAVLYVRGRVPVLSDPQIAMVGSRNPTAGGRDTARVFAGFFARAGLCITSGLALGIDAASHEGALAAGGITIGVLGCGLDDMYPREHRGLAERIAATGAVISEFPPGTPARRANFPQRNRIIAGLSAGTLVVEAARRSGSLITARLAGNAGREVFAIPGSIHNPCVRGCHELIRQGAKLVECADDVLVELKISLANQLVATAPSAVGRASQNAPTLDKAFEILLDALAFEPASVDSLIERTGMNSESIASMLLILELDGHVAPHPGGRYSRMARQ
jgi:DNA processing protein